tara:strand:+ start:399 stop:701 length:303 start_codon:yes stop_codon:yes gene_type:complete
MKKEIRLARAIKKLPAFRVFDWKSDTDSYQQPTLKLKHGREDYYLAIIDRGQGKEVEGAFDYEYEERYLVKAMDDWAKKYGFRWECIINDGLYGLVEGEK